MQKHTFEPKAFRRRLLPLLFFIMLPSFLLDVYFAYNLAFHRPGFFIQTATGSFLDVAAPFISNFILLKAPFIFAYFKIREQRLGSYVQVDERQVLYRKSRMRLSLNL